MKIYIASSWKNERPLINIARILREKGHEVDCFCDGYNGRFTFSAADSKISHLDCIEFIKQDMAVTAFLEDKKWLDWADAVVMVLPCGKSAHLEAGYAVGKGKKLFILGEFPEGDWDVMYGFADGLFREFTDLRDNLEPPITEEG